MRVRWIVMMVLAGGLAARGEDGALRAELARVARELLELRVEVMQWRVEVMQWRVESLRGQLARAQGERVRATEARRATEREIAELGAGVEETERREELRGVRLEGELRAERAAVGREEARLGELERRMRGN